MAKGDTTPFFFERFPRYCEIQQVLRLLAQQFPNNARVESIGKSIQGRSIDMIVVQKDPSKPKDAVMIEAGAHAREWLAHSTALYFAYYLLKQRNLLNYMDYYIIPCLNPDGYEHTHICKRLWRKNLNPNRSFHADNWGVDLNRNFSFGFGVDGGSSPEHSNLKHRGPYSFSEPESRSLAYALDIYGRHIKLYIALHCFGNFILYPWGFTTTTISDEDDLRVCGRKAAKAMKAAFTDSRFRVGPVATRLYLLAGGSIDYARGSHGIKFSYMMELHKGGENKFDPPASYIAGVGEETTVGIKAMALHVHDYYQYRRKMGIPENSGKKQNNQSLCIALGEHTFGVKAMVKHVYQYCRRKIVLNTDGNEDEQGGKNEKMQEDRMEYFISFY